MYLGMIQKIDRNRNIMLNLLKLFKDAPGALRCHVTNVTILNLTDVTLVFTDYLTSNKINTLK